MGKHRPLPDDPAQRRQERWRRHLECMHRYREKVWLAEHYAGLDPANVEHLDLVGLAMPKRRPRA